MEPAGADVVAGAALDAVHDVEGLGLLPHPLSGVQMHVHGGQVHGADVDAAGAAQADFLGLNGGGFFPGQAEHRVGALDDADFQRMLGNAHHGAAGKHPVGLLGKALGLVDQMLEGGAQRHQQVAGLLDGVAGDGDDAVGDGLAFHHGVVHRGGGADVEHRAAYMGGQAAGGHLAAGEALDELLLSALGIPGAQGLHMHVGAGPHQGLEMLNGVGLIGLHADGGALQPEGLHQNARAADDPLPLLQHQPVVCGDVGFALGAVKDEGVHLADAGTDLHMGGEPGAAHTGNARFLDDLHDLIRRQLGVVGMGRQVGAEGILEIVLDDHGHDLVPAGIRPGLYRRHRPGHRRMDGGAQTGDLADLLSYRHVVALGHHALAGRADVHRHGDDDLLGRGTQGRHCLVACRLFPVIGVHASIKALLHRSTSQIRAHTRAVF